MKIAMIELYFFLLEDAHFGYGIQQGNILPSLPYIPGRVVRGALAGWAIRNGKVKGGSSIFDRLFLVEDAHDSVISFPNCYHRGSLPAPFSLFETKGRAYDPRTALVAEPSKVYLGDPGGQEKTIVDFLRRTEWPSDLLPMEFEPFRGCVDRLERLISPAPLVLDLRAHHDTNLGRVGEDGLYAEEAVPSAPWGRSAPWENVYRGRLTYVEDDEVPEVFAPLMDSKFYDTNDQCGIPLDNPPPGHLVFLGRRKVPALVYGIDRGMVDTEAGLPDEFKKQDHSSLLTISFISDVLASELVLTADLLNRFLGTGKLEKVRVFSKSGLAYGYDTTHKATKNPRLPPKRVLAAGTCGLFKAHLDQKAKQILWALSLMGMGEGNRDGFGRFIVNWSVHDIE